jgi:hypothetical protein
MNRILAIAVFLSIAPLILRKNKALGELKQRVSWLKSENWTMNAFKRRSMPMRRPLTGFTSDDFIGIGPSGTMRTKPQVISDFTSGDLKFQSIATSDVRIRIYGSTAVETGISIMIGQDKGKVVPGDNRLTRCG